MSDHQESNLQELLQKVPNNSITQAQTQPRSLYQLYTIGRQRGFENFINRKQIWPFLLEIDNKLIKQTPVYEWKGGMDKNSHDYEQLQKDADRSLASMKTFQSITKFHLYSSNNNSKKKQEAVLAVLDTFFAKNPELKYIQGFHDVASVFLILFGNSSGYYLMEKAGRTYFYDFLTLDFGQVGYSTSQIVYQLVTSADPDFEDIFCSYKMTKLLIFIIPWILTWFSHNFSSVKTICRIWDYLLCTGPHGVFYLTAGIILSTKKDLLQNCDELDEPSIQMFYQEQAKKCAIDVEGAIFSAIQLQQKISITELQGYETLNKRSIFRKQNFNKQFKNYEKYEKEHHMIVKRQKNMKRAVKIVIGIAIVGAAVMGGKYIMSHNYSIKSLVGEL